MKDYVRELEKWHIEALKSFAAYQAIMFCKAPNKVGHIEAVKNLAAMDQYPALFSTLRSSSRFSSIAHLSRLFIGYEDKRRRIISYSLPHLLEKLKLYEGVDSSKLDELIKSINENVTLIQNLKTLRDQQIGHIDPNPQDLKFKDDEFKKLLELSEDIICFAELCVNSREYFKPYKHLELEVEEDIRRLLNFIH